LDEEVDGQYNASRELAQLLDEKLAAFKQDSRTASASITPFEISSASEMGKSSSKVSNHIPKLPLDQNLLSDNSVAQATAKSAWAKDDDGKGKKGTTTSISLRAIQEAEARRQQSLKATEREKEKTRAGITPEAKEDVQPFTTSWGLPTSQAGARTNTYPLTKDVPAFSVAAIQSSPVSPVWTATVPTPSIKKSMKEIQEEEEKRKTQPVTLRDTSVTATSKKAYAETTSKASTISPLC
jgi:PERQ amino acid-rich with GYF domain-containing protein